MAKNEKKLGTEELKERAKVELGLEDEEKKETEEKKGEENMSNKQKQTKKGTTAKKQTEQKQTKEKKATKSEKQIITATKLAEEFEMTPKVLRRKLRAMDECHKPIDGSPYQWYEDSGELKNIREKLQQQKERRNQIR